MAEKTKDKIKYKLLKFIDLSGFKVFDPPVRLAFGEDPKKQTSEIGKFIILPLLFVSLCLLSWHIIAPTHKTKSGAVPTPGKILNAYGDNIRLSEREEEKEYDFLAAGQERRDRLTFVEKAIPELEAKAARLQKLSVEAQKQGEKIINDKIAPLKAKLDPLKAKHKAAKAARKAAVANMAATVAAKQATPEDSIKLAIAHAEQAEAESEAEKILNDQVNAIRNDPPESMNDAKIAANSAADEVQHFKKRFDVLTKENKEIKRTALMAKIAEDEAALASSIDPAVIARKTKSIATNRKKLEKEDQKFAKNKTLGFQTIRSLATVFVGFLIAAAIAIPVGIMCGLNKIVMACLTPIISIFRPVSPVVWLLIFQIVVGAFFLPDPASHPLFTTLNQAEFFASSWLEFGNPLAYLQTDAAMIFSACTVAMCALWPALVNTALGVSAIDRDHLNVARVLKLGFWARLFKIIIPSSLPLVFAGLRISLGVGWMVLIAAEALSSSDGLGKYVWDEYQNGSSQSFANIILACFIVGIIGFFLDRIMIVLQRLVSFDDGSSTA